MAALHKRGKRSPERLNEQPEVTQLIIVTAHSRD